MVMSAMTIAMMMVLVMLIISTEALRQVGWVRQQQYRHFYRQRAF
jgi:hypothetical protein